MADSSSHPVLVYQPAPVPVTPRSSPQPHHPDSVSEPARSPKRKRKELMEVCWGDAFSGGNLGCAKMSHRPKGAFREHFCRRCREQGVCVPISRVRVPVGEGSGEIGNRKTGGCWNEPSLASHLPAHRVIGRAKDCAGPVLVILRDEAPPLPGLAEAAALSLSDPVRFRVGRTLIPPPMAAVVAVPAQHQLSPGLRLRRLQQARTSALGLANTCSPPSWAAPRPCAFCVRRPPGKYFGRKGHSPQRRVSIWFSFMV
ncbi:hypothetical protein EMIHUDRAFT_211844 [Emiliania huxleyi CCMP1516]|uniref:SBP-type domain-containing protein n=2 Tax=Emiliania huxleyi TaxID=2903 RepID=A0A0D3I1C0_EMIH1|nr:hypothetical protein EMIHUDRAFT_250340 [Emiliania huxleyi CCMP1516]XP_005766833.1 hypothetical protein EMIHUDRAFT_211844 [Emiliania huxleyi CCMP1516]EOD05055.1 hypothetical protein EMIHUDRAFT_250340 [Emiliania huxleyi CCMP1516]EOD14404.1 hypothetical protein EMIHUDRAFT_211844 [Emiliania huxleyi CCMP1516]|eukprot:XP_005757484.1 hypothetical protein EMIHUDRAFT_250340 [Emiliania huxleyi CCMP1516]